MKNNNNFKIIIVLITGVLLSAGAFLAGYYIEEKSFGEANCSLQEGVEFPININTATAQELDMLLGIGEVLSQRIVQYRTQHGDFKDKRELFNVEGIAEERYKKIQHYITVG